MKKPTTEVSDKRGSRGRQRGDTSFPAPPSHAGLPDDYAAILAEIKQRTQTKRLRVVMAANTAMVTLYWGIGRQILARQEQQGWEARVIDRLSLDLKTAFPDMSGLSPRNLKYMRKFAESWLDREFVQRTVAQIPWRSNVALLFMRLFATAYPGAQIVKQLVSQLPWGHAATIKEILRGWGCEGYACQKLG